MTKQNYIVFDIETTGLNPWYGDRITCICAKDNNGKRFDEVLGKEDDEYERNLIAEFIDWCLDEDKRLFRFVTYNGKQFDIPFIMTRLFLTTQKNRTELFLAFAGGVMSFINESDIDIFAEIEKLTGKRLSLDTVSKLMGCTNKSGKGVDAILLWKENKFDELKSYCMQDVDTTEEVYLKYLKL